MLDLAEWEATYQTASYLLWKNVAARPEQAQCAMGVIAYDRQEKRLFFNKCMSGTNSLGNLCMMS